ncbi:MAG: NAD-dependent epimerase/dehydratase family protein [Steroidobacteraceae bacterium]
MIVLVTGATGFVGRRLCERLAADGVQVRATYRSSHQSATAGIEWRQLPRFDDVQAWLALLPGVDTVIHLAALAHQVGRSGMGRWCEFEHANVTCTAALVRACAIAGTPRFVFLSSIAVHGAASDRRIDVHACTNPVTDYGRSKLLAEQAIQTALGNSGTDWCIIRSPLVYGPGNPGNMERLLRLMRTGMPLPFGAIRNLRSFIFVDNLVDALVTASRREAPIRNSYVVADGTDMSTPELVGALAEASGMRARVFAMPVWMLRLMAKVGDFIEMGTGRMVPFNSYSIDRLRESLSVDGSAFATAFRWAAPVAPATALRVTCHQITDKDQR